MPQVISLEQVSLLKQTSKYLFKTANAWMSFPAATNARVFCDSDKALKPFDLLANFLNDKIIELFVPFDWRQLSEV